MGFWLYGRHRVSALPYWGRGRLRLRAVRSLRTGEPPRGPGGRFEHLSPRPLAPVVGAASQIPHEFTTEKSGKCDPCGGLKSGVLATVNWLVFHGSLLVAGTFSERTQQTKVY